jgi:hypothetical protein
LVKAGLPEAFRFAGLSYPSARQREEQKAKDPEGESLVKLLAWHELRLTLKTKGLETEWQSIAGAAQVWRALVVFENRSEMLLFVGRSSEQVRANIEPAFNDLLDDEEKLKAQSISLQRWHGAPDAGRWMHQTNLTMPSKTLLAKVA